MPYTKQVATALYEKLLGLIAIIPDQIQRSSDDGLALPIICESLEKAIAALTGR